MGDICIAESGKAGRNHLVAIWHSPGADASNPLSTCCLTGLCLHSRQIATVFLPCIPAHNPTTERFSIMPQSSESWTEMYYVCNLQIHTQKLCTSIYIHQYTNSHSLPSKAQSQLWLPSPLLPPAHFPGHRSLF